MAGCPVGLILGNPGSDDADEGTLDVPDALDDPVETLDLTGVVSDFNQWNTYLEGKGVKVSRNSACDSGLTREAAIQKIWTLFGTFSSHYILVYLGHGRKGSGNWQMSDDDVTFLDIVFAWLQLGYLPSHGNSCTVVSDCCFSGKWPLLAMNFNIPGLQFQSAVDGDTLARDSWPTFSQIFLRMHSGHDFPKQFMLRWKPLCCARDGDAHHSTRDLLHLVGAVRVGSRFYLERLYSKSGIITGFLTTISFCNYQSDNGRSMIHKAVAQVHDHQVGKVVVEDTQDGLPFLIKEIWCNPDARRTSVATRLLTGILQHLKADHVDVEFETTNVGLMEFLLAHGFQDVYTTPQTCQWARHDGAAG
ncbi:unnamed protein product [Durusdinium trenchii]|uniref:N-acetyltransferase domain-containing protein n=1 Tax=Durusdinium trenchii TaxID=1381693 RepID=A0ABP0SCL5_9DINO